MTLKDFNPPIFLPRTTERIEGPALYLLDYLLRNHPPSTYGSFPAST